MPDDLESIPELDEIHQRIATAMTEPARLVLRHLVKWCEFYVSEYNNRWHLLDSEDTKGLLELQTERKKMLDVKEYLESHIRSPRPEDNPEGPEGGGE
jgi:hypothetical protein